MGTHPIFESDFDCLTDENYIMSGLLRISNSCWSKSPALAQRWSRPLSGTSRMLSEKDQKPVEKGVDDLKRIALEYYEKMNKVENGPFRLSINPDKSLIDKIFCAFLAVRIVVTGLTWVTMLWTLRLIGFVLWYIGGAIKNFCLVHYKIVIPTVAGLALAINFFCDFKSFSPSNWKWDKKDWEKYV